MPDRSASILWFSPGLASSIIFAIISVSLGCPLIAAGLAVGDEVWFCANAGDAMNAAASVTNIAAVSGGGQTNTTNDSANDVTTIDAGPPVIALVKSVNPSGSQIPGTELIYTIVYTNNGGNPASSFIVIDPNPANVDALERVFHNIDFKIGSMTSSPGTSGLATAFSYSNDGGTTWTYAPVSGGGGAATGYDRNVTNIRWTFTGNLSQTSPNNTGSVSFTARIR